MEFQTDIKERKGNLNMNKSDKHCETRDTEVRVIFHKETSHEENVCNNLYPGTLRYDV